MKKASKFSTKGSGMVIGILIGAGISFGVVLLGAAALAWLITFEKVGENAMVMGPAVILPLASWLGSCVTWRCVGQNRLAVWGAHSGAFYLLLLLGALPFGGQFEGLDAGALLVLLGGGLTFIPGILGHKNGGKKYKMKAFR